MFPSHVIGSEHRNTCNCSFDVWVSVDCMLFSVKGSAAASQTSQTTSSAKHVHTENSVENVIKSSNFSNYEEKK